MLICLTGTIIPQTSNYSIPTDINLRLKEYTDNILYLITDSPCDRIVFCENSLFQHEIFASITYLANSLWKSFEYLTFLWDIHEIQQRWRWFGEQKILEYFIDNSKLLSWEKSFYKITGRYKVTNIKEILQANREMENIFFYMSPWHRRVSTAFFRSSISFFREELYGCENNINDSKGESYQIEGIYTKILNQKRSLTKTSKILPIFWANTGSGYRLRPFLIKDTFKQFLNKLWFYSL